MCSKTNIVFNFIIARTRLKAIGTLYMSTKYITQVQNPFLGLRGAPLLLQPISVETVCSLANTAWGTNIYSICMAPTTSTFYNDI